MDPLSEHPKRNRAFECEIKLAVFTYGNRGSVKADQRQPAVFKNSGWGRITLTNLKGTNIDAARQPSSRHFHSGLPLCV